MSIAIAPTALECPFSNSMALGKLKVGRVGEEIGNIWPKVGETGEAKRTERSGPPRSNKPGSTVVGGSSKIVVSGMGCAFRRSSSLSKP